MPTSHHTYISDVIGIVRGLQPKSILDVGVGFGKWGHLFREYLDVMHGRIFRKDWQVKIAGVEIFMPYIQEHQKHIYDYLFIQNILSVDIIKPYDLIFASDVIEHIAKDDAKQFIFDKLLPNCRDLILVIPTGPGWMGQKAMYGNKHEAHISTWSSNELFGFTKQFTCNGKQITLFHMKGKLK